MKEKRSEKKKLEEEKANRKRIREEKKKTNIKSKKSQKQLVFDDDDDWVCKICSKRYSAELILHIRCRWIECDECKNAFHYKCIPKKHLDAFGLDE